MKKTIILFLLLAFSGYMSVSANVLETQNTKNLSASVLQWKLFTNSQASDANIHGAGKKINCDLKPTKELTQWNLNNKDAYDVKMAALKISDPGYVQDVKGCIVQDRVDSFISWIVYLAIIVLSILSLFKLVMGMLGGGSKGQSDPMPMPDGSGGGGGSGYVMKEIKPLLVTIAILFLLVLGILNPILEGVAWLKDAIIG